MLSALILGLSLIDLILLIWTFTWSGKASARLWFIRAMLFGMCYDNLMIGLGNAFIGADWYQAANVLRFFFHSSILPFLTLFALSAMQVTSAPLASNKLLISFCWLFTIIAIAYGLYHEVYLLELGPESVLGVNKLTDTSGTPPMATIFTNILIIPMSALVWKASGWRWFFLGSIFIFLVNGATGAMEWGFVAGNFVEVIFITSLIVTERYLRSRETT